MFLFSKKEKNMEGLKSPEVIKAREYLCTTHLCDDSPFQYVETTQNGVYNRYHFYEGNNTRIVYVVLSDEERESIIQLFTRKMKQNGEKYDEITYMDSIMGISIGLKVKHRFLITQRCRKALAFMFDNGNIDIPIVVCTNRAD